MNYFEKPNPYILNSKSETKTFSSFKSLCTYLFSYNTFIPYIKNLKISEN